MQPNVPITTDLVLLGAGHAHVEAIVGRRIDSSEFTAAMRRLTTGGLVHDPVFLPAGALQCQGRLEPTPDGVAAVQAMIAS